MPNPANSRPPSAPIPTPPWLPFMNYRIETIGSHWPHLNPCYHDKHYTSGSYPSSTLANFAAEALIKMYIDKGTFGFEFDGEGFVMAHGEVGEEARIAVRVWKDDEVAEAPRRRRRVGKIEEGGGMGDGGLRGVMEREEERWRRYWSGKMG